MSYCYFSTFIFAPISVLLLFFPLQHFLTLLQPHATFRKLFDSLCILDFFHIFVWLLFFTAFYFFFFLFFFHCRYRNNIFSFVRIGDSISILTIEKWGYFVRKKQVNGSRHTAQIYLLCNRWNRWNIRNPVLFTHFSKCNFRIFMQWKIILSLYLTSKSVVLNHVINTVFERA